MTRLMTSKVRSALMSDSYMVTHEVIQDDETIFIKKIVERIFVNKKYMKPVMGRTRRDVRVFCI